jgi:NADP-dependent 3-hydroxy acid dehydrogenase YdfG
MGSVLVNNAGKSPARPVSMETFDQFWNTIEVNFKGVRTSLPSFAPDFPKSFPGNAVYLPGASGDA